MALLAPLVLALAVAAHSPGAGPSTLRFGGDSLGGAPYLFLDPREPDRLTGFEHELAEALAARLGKRAVFVQGQWDRLLELLGRGDFDVALNGLEFAPEKERVALLGRPYYAAGFKLTVRRGDANAPRSAEALAGRAVGALPGSLPEALLRRLGAAVRTYDGGQGDLYRDLQLGRLDAVLMDGPITHYYADLDPTLETLPGSLGTTRYVAALAPGNEPLRAALDGALDSLARDGTLRRLYERWDLWNPETAALLGDADVTPRTPPEAWERWRGAVERTPSLRERLTERYPRVLPALLRGAGMTLAVSLCAMALALVLGAALALGRAQGSAWLRYACLAWVEFFRGTPLLLQLTLVYFGLPELGVRLEPFTAGVLALGLNYAAAEAENDRAGLESVPRGQLEAARVLGLSRWATLRHVVAPQALRVALPPMTNDFIALLKDSSLVSLVTMTELSRTYGQLATGMRDHLGLGVLVAGLYLLMGLPFAWLARRVERHVGRHLQGDTR
ncbi:MAG: hypothetical protein RL653_2719 [Pseudomonadota bacterium]|jgi:polar amino acid transport system substrate-binding protein